jgi:rhamnogalacturonyl hydrolase YesR
MAFLDAYEIFREQNYLEVADSICRWILNLGRNGTEKGFCFSYTASGGNGCTIHNHNMLAAAMLARSTKHVARDAYLRAAREAMRFSCSRQQVDGRWYYGEAPSYRWIDNFHTGYNLDGLKCYIESTGDIEYEPHLMKGFEFYKTHFFENNGRPKYYHNRVYPVDIQCASQAIETLSNFSERDPDALDLAQKVAVWTIENMQDAEGYFYYRQYPLIKARTPMLHWAQATTYRALALLLSKLTRNADG